MRKSKGQWVASYRDTYSLDTTLSPIIYAGLSKFHDVLEQKNREGKCLGIPNEYMKNEADWVTDSDVQDWLDDIKKMMYAFENKEPDISLYGFKLRLEQEADARESICSSAEALHAVGAVDDEFLADIGEVARDYTIECDNLEEKARYRADCEEHERLVQEGLDLFSQKFKSLWW